jgi:hypothetical protein
MTFRNYRTGENSSIYNTVAAVVAGIGRLAADIVVHGKSTSALLTSVRAETNARPSASRHGVLFGCHKHAVGADSSRDE